MITKNITDISIEYPERIKIFGSEIDFDDSYLFESYYRSFSDEKFIKIQKKNLQDLISVFNNTKQLKTKKKRLVDIVSHSSIESYRFIENLALTCDKKMQSFVNLSKIKSQAIIEIDFYDAESRPIYICSGLGGEKNKLKYFISFIYKEQLQKNEFAFLIEEINRFISNTLNGSISQTGFKNNKLFFYTLIPVHYDIFSSIKKLKKIISEINKNKIIDIFICNYKPEIEIFLQHKNGK
ncbi:MAG: hypothetical protein LBV69_00100 [Bacteroidales bacterium]|jgi:hypothetical protein|nr:hypothetical protein [Bacteroidales bacterium]